LNRRPNEEIISYGNIIDKRFTGINLEEISRLVQSLYSPTIRINKVPLLQQTLFSRNVPAATIAVGNNPSGIVFDGTQIWVANYGSNSLSKINTIKNELEATVPVGYGPSGVAFDGKFIWVANCGSNNVSKIDIISDMILSSVHVLDSPTGLAFDSTYIWVINNWSKNVMKIKY
jgi:YVTN family beta-propeller protein